MTRVAAVDYGLRRIGLAVSDPLGLTVRGLETLHRPDEALEGAVEAVAGRLEAEGVGRVVVGLPLHEDGSESEMSRRARRFGEALARRTGWAVEYLDEGLTSWEAEERLKESGRRLRDARRRGDVDREAACLLLRSWLRERPSAQGPPRAGPAGPPP